MGIKIDRDAIRDLADILNETGLTEIEVEEKDTKIRVAKNSTIVTAPAVAAPTTISLPQETPVVTASVTSAVIDANHSGAVTSPMVGTAYHAPEPGAAPFISVGQKINIGDTLMIIEAMKVMNPIKAEKAGTITNIVAADASPVEFGDVLVIIE